MKLLITGSGGLLGSKLCELAIEKKHELYSLYSQHRPLQGVPIKVDISDRNAIEKALGKTEPETVVHTAALTDVDKCELQKELAWKVNVEGTTNLAELCKLHEVFLVYISTDYVFDGKKGLYKEDDEPNPINYYGLAKLKGEDAVKDLLEDYCIARTSVLYGSTAAAGKINFALWLLEKLKHNEEVKIVTDQWNSPTLNTNLANMLLEIAEQRIRGVYHLAGATRISRYDFSRLIAKAFGLDASLIEPSLSEEFQWIAKRPVDSSLDVKKAQQTLRNKPLPIEKALEIIKKEIK
jgi:dTDP-4-dehydrorhamnose reductase